MIYLITNTLTNDQYVGKTKNGARHRWNQHQATARRGSNTRLARAIRKYGADVFLVEQIDDEYSNEAERRWISKLSPTYNMTPGGDGGWIYDQTGNRWQVSEEGKKNMRDSRARNKDKRIETSKKYRYKVAGGNNYQCNYRITTPWGVYYSWTDASNAAKQQRAIGNNQVVADITTLKKYCRKGVLLSTNGRRTHPSWRGKHTWDIGFAYQEI